jgi:ubiquinone/menaquinone biosynthesis C-methylase UbiE
MLDEARHRVGGTLVQSDMRTLPLADACLDGVWMCAALLHLPRAEVPGVLGEVGRVLRPGGVVYISVKEGEGEGWQEAGWRRYFTYYQPDELTQLVEAAGFTVEDMWTKAGEKAVWISVVGQLG